MTFHPATLNYGETPAHVDALMTALATADRPILFTYPNADTAGKIVIAAIKAFVASHPNARAVTHLGSADYFGMMAASAAMVGNSSSGLVEAPSFALPVVNIGDRQRGRLRAANVIDCPAEAGAIAGAIRQAAGPTFTRSLAGMANPYGDGRAAARIVVALRVAALDVETVKKRFFDLPGADHLRVALAGAA